MQRTAHNQDSDNGAGPRPDSLAYTACVLTLRVFLLDKLYKSTPRPTSMPVIFLPIAQHVRPAVSVSRLESIGLRWRIPRTNVAEEQIEWGKFILDAIPCEHVEVFEEHRDNCLRVKKKRFQSPCIETKKKEGRRRTLNLLSTLSTSSPSAAVGVQLGGGLLSTLPPMGPPSASSVAEACVWFWKR